MTVVGPWQCIRLSFRKGLTRLPPASRRATASKFKMSHIVDTLLTDLRSLVTDLGKDGGLMGVSVYDTAQVLRLYPAQDRIEPAIGWLLSQQQADGGWGCATLPHARDAPTLAT